MAPITMSDSMTVHKSGMKGQQTLTVIRGRLCALRAAEVVILVVLRQHGQQSGAADPLDGACIGCW
jgi:hypothetical protein